MANSKEKFTENSQLKLLRELGIHTMKTDVIILITKRENVYHLHILEFSMWNWYVNEYKCPLRGPLAVIFPDHFTLSANTYKGLGIWECSSTTTSFPLMLVTNWSGKFPLYEAWMRVIHVCIPG